VLAARSCAVGRWWKDRYIVSSAKNDSIPRLPSYMGGKFPPLHLSGRKASANCSTTSAEWKAPRTRLHDTGCRLCSSVFARDRPPVRELLLSRKIAPRQQAYSSVIPSRGAGRTRRSECSEEKVERASAGPPVCRKRPYELRLWGLRVTSPHGPYGQLDLTRLFDPDCERTISRRVGGICVDEAHVPQLRRWIQA